MVDKNQTSSPAPTILDVTGIAPEVFEPGIGEIFLASQGENQLSLKLVSVKRGSDPIPGVRDRASFSLIFLSETEPHTRYSLPVRLEHPSIGVLEHVSIDANCGVPFPEWGKGHLWSAVFG